MTFWFVLSPFYSLRVADLLATLGLLHGFPVGVLHTLREFWFILEFSSREKPTCKTISNGLHWPSVVRWQSLVMRSYFVGIGLPLCIKLFWRQHLATTCFATPQMFYWLLCSCSWSKKFGFWYLWWNFLLNLDGCSRCNLWKFTVYLFKSCKWLTFSFILLGEEL